MRVFTLLLLCFAGATYTYGQKTEVAFQLNSGLSRFRGESAAETSAINNITARPSSCYTDNAYGQKSGISYGALVQLQRVTSSNLLYGIQAGVESLRSKVKITGLITYGDYYTSYRDYQKASGRTILINNFINLQPYLGYRFKVGAINLDPTLGIDFGFCQKSKEDGQAKDTNGNKVETSYQHSKLEAVDIRPRIGITAYYNHFGASLNYAHGLTNYKAGYDGANPEAYSRVLRLGLLYRL